MVWASRKKQAVPSEHKFQKGWLAGYKPYRYGPAKPITLARTSIEKKPQLVFSRKERDRIVSDVADRMRNWRLTRFEKEGALRAGLRSVLCLGGHSWPAADGEAERCVAEALLALGAERPDWTEGQRHYVIPRENCAWCACDMEPDAWGRYSQFCSVECSRAALVHRSVGDEKQDTAWRTSAYRIITRESQPPLTCEYCGVQFRSHDGKVRYCSPMCVGKANKGYLQDKKCAWCSKTFHPQRDTILCCSRTCGAAYRGKLFRDANPERECAECGEIFAPTAPHVIHCSGTCKRRMQYRRKKERDLWSAEVIAFSMPLLTAKIFDSWFRRAA